MKYRFKSEFLDYCLKKKKTLGLSVLFGIVFTFALYYGGKISQPEFRIYEDGEKSSIDFGSLEEKEINLEVMAEYGDSSILRHVTIRRENSQSKEVAKRETENSTMSSSEIASLEVSRIVKDLNQESGQIIELPLTSPGGVKLKWMVPQRGKEFLIPLGFPSVIMLFLYRGEKDKQETKEKNDRESLLRELPGFNNKLVLLLESGLIYEEAIDRICRKSDSGGFVTSVFSKAIEESGLMNGHVNKIVGDYARDRKLAELSRLVSIVSESRDRGTDLREKLNVEGEILWEKRKRQAEEVGKLVDTKLALPLGMMLISLLMVTAAPALLQF